MPRRKTRRSKGQGTIIVRKDRSNQVVAIIRFTDEFGKKRVIKRVVPTRTEGERIIKKTLRDIEEHGSKIIEGDRLQFTRLAEIYSDLKLTEPVYKDDVKISGLRSHHIQKVYLRSLVEYFAKKLVASIRHTDLEAYRSHRLATPKRDGKDRSITSVNRELTLLRTIFSFAKHNGWIAKSPFEMGSSLVNVANEKHRQRTLSKPEEDKLLEACVGRRSHIRPILIAAIDTGMRRGELLSLQWRDVDLKMEIITVRAMTTKTLRTRTVGLTRRLCMELRALASQAPPDPNVLVFGITDNFKRSFAAACAAAGIADFRFHDCRHTALTRMIEAGMPALQVMQISGHTQMQTFKRYINANEQAAKRAAAALDAWLSQESASGAQESALIN